MIRSACWNSLIAAGSGDQRDPESAEEPRVPGFVAVPERRAAAQRRVSIAAAATDALRATRPQGVDRFSLRAASHSAIERDLVGAPLRDVAVQVVETELVRREGAHRRGTARALGRGPRARARTATEARQVEVERLAEGEGSGRARAAGVLPLGFARERQARALQVGEEGARVEALGGELVTIDLRWERTALSLAPAGGREN